MGGVFGGIEAVFEYVVRAAILLMEIAGVAVLLVTGIKSFIGWIKKRSEARLELAQGIALALTFKMGGELLRSVIVRDWSELLILGAIVILRGLLTFLIQWEIKNEKRSMAEIQ